MIYTIEYMPFDVADRDCGNYSSRSGPDARHRPQYVHVEQPETRHSTPVSGVVAHSQDYRDSCRVP